MELVHLEPVEHPGPHRLDEIPGFELRLLEPVAADEARALEHRVVELAPGHDVGAGCDDERACSEPLPSQHGIARGRDRRDDLALRRVPVALTGLGAGALAERREALGRSAERDDAFDRRNRRSDAGDLRLGLVAAADDAERSRAASREMPGRDAAGRSRAQLSEPVRLDDRDELRRLGIEEAHDERRALGRRGVQLGAGETRALRLPQPCLQVRPREA